MHCRLTRKRSVLAAAMSALALGALSVAAGASAAKASPTETTSRPSTQPSLLGGSAIKKGNDIWAGYAATGGKKPFTYVEAMFKVAAVNCHVTPHLSTTSQWVGLDGWHNKTVEQIGVASDCGGEPGPPNAAHYYAWWEMYPDPLKVIEPVKAGDTIVATVYQIPAGSPGDALEYVLTVQDLTKSGVPKSYLEPCPKKSVCKDASAEVVEEGYNEKPWKGPADFGRESFSDISLGEYGDLIGNFATKSWTNLALFQKQKKVDAVPTALSHGGTAFSVVWHSDK
jgi:Peptidase A4 family